MNSGGAERVMSLLVNHFASKGDEVHLFVFSKDPSFYELDSAIKVYYLYDHKNGLGKIGTFCRHFLNFFKMNRLVKKTGVECLVSFTTVVNCITILLGRVNRIPVVISERNEPMFYNPGSVINFIRKSLYRYATSIVLQTERSAKSFDLLKIRLPSNKKVIFNPIDASFKNENLERKNVIVSVGRQSFEKGHDLLISAFALSDSANWELHLIGDGVERNKLISLSEELGVAHRIVWHGKQKDISKFLNESSIFVLPSRTEGFPNALCEAMICGCAVISFDCPNGPSEIIQDHHNGILVTNGDVNKLGEAIGNLVNQPLLRTSLGKNAALLKDQLNKDIICLQWQDHIDFLLKTNNL